MKNIATLFIVFFSFFSFANEAKHSAEGGFKIKSYRFNQHAGLSFERLVIEFTSDHGSTGTPEVTQTISHSGKETSVKVANASLLGAIPESNINDSYKSKSKYLGPISINTDQPANGFTVRTFVKNSEVNVDSLWLNNPPRLIIDTYPKHSPRAEGPNVLGSRQLAAHGSHKSHGSKDSKHNPASTHKQGKTVVCYPSNAQVKLSVGFTAGNDVSNYQVEGGEAVNDVLCFPSHAQIAPEISYELKTAPAAFLKSPKSNTSLFDKALLPSTTLPTTHTKELAAPKKSNEDMDPELILNNSENEMNTTRSLSNSNYDDNFNKNAPPPTLGKSLLLPPPAAKEEGEESSPAKAGFINPEALLPPL